MELEVSAWTRRDRLERIAAAERDRRAGRIGLCRATLGEATEWPARVILALCQLPEDEGADARGILEETLDLWAAECGLSLEDAAIEEIDPADAPQPAALVADSADINAAAPESEPEAPDVLEEPIEMDEFERAFAEAEAQTDEMVDVNQVAARVLMDEPLGLSELSGEGLEVADDVALEAWTSLEPDDEADVHEANISESDSSESNIQEASAMSDVDAASVPEFGPSSGIAFGPPPDQSITSSSLLSSPSPIPTASRMESATKRDSVIATLERWLVNLEGARSRVRPEDRLGGAL